MVSLKERLQSKPIKIGIPKPVFAIWIITILAFNYFMTPTIMSHLSFMQMPFNYITYYIGQVIFFGLIYEISDMAFEAYTAKRKDIRKAFTRDLLMYLILGGFLYAGYIYALNYYGTMGDLMSFYILTISAMVGTMFGFLLAESVRQVAIPRGLVKQKNGPILRLKGILNGKGK
jgi:small-conductance mechanosensitive channel